jgi:predicted Rossmann fold flavoprotein
VPLPHRCDVVIVGAGAAGLMTAIHARARAHSTPHVVLLDGAAKPGAKILVSGGSRCNVTNAIVNERDFFGGKSTIVRRILRGFPVAETVAFFDTLGIALREEPGGKLFPVSNRSRDVLDALVRATTSAGVDLQASTRVLAIARDGDSFAVTTTRGSIAAHAVVLATGGLSLPKTGSDGAGYDFARALGHTIVPTTPALVPLLLATTNAVHSELSGVSHDVEVAVWIDGSLALRQTGSLLWTHVGVSGPVILDASRHWARARLDERSVRVTINMYPGQSFSTVDEAWIDVARRRPTATIRSTLANDLPDAVADAVLRTLELDGRVTLARFARDDRRRLVSALVEWPLAVTDTRGYNFAEVTAGGVALTEIDPASMESRTCPGLFLVGEILDVDGRIGGFNFQWSWATGRIAGAALAGRAWTPPASGDSMGASSLP